MQVQVSQKMTVLIGLFSVAVSFGATLGATLAKGKHFEKELTYGSPFIILAAAAFFLFMIRMKDGKYKPSEKIRHVIDLFCSCSFGMDRYKKYMDPADLSAWIAIPGLVLIITILSFISVWIIRRTKIGRKIT